MDPKKFAHSSAGRVARTPEGYWAFIPAPLPRTLPYSSTLVRLLADAATNLGHLVGVGYTLPDPYLFIYPYMHQEAVLSSRIENTQASLSDLYMFETEAHAPVRHADVLEVSNYVHALQLGWQRLSDLPLSLRLVREIHARLMQGVRGQEQTPGDFRRSQNWIGPAGCTLINATYVPPPVPEMWAALDDWEKFLHAATDLPPLVQAALMHYQFEAIHPFLDGNGRVGRLLITLFLCARGPLPLPLLYLSPFFEQHRDEYYTRLLAVSQQGDWDEWICFFLRGVAHQARTTFAQAQVLLRLRQDYQEKVQSITRAGTATRLVDLLFANPIVTVNTVAQQLGISKPAARRAIEILMAAEILTETTGRSWSRTYVATDLLTLLESAAPDLEGPAGLISPAIPAVPETIPDNTLVTEYP